MSFRTRQESQMVDALTKGRAQRKKIGAPGTKSQATEQSQLEEKGMQPPPPPSLSAKDEEIALVKTLEVTKYDGNRKFPGLARQKIEKKDRHRKALDEFTKFLDELAGAIEQDVLRLSRQMMEDVEKVDQSLAGSYQLLQDETFIIPKSEDDLKDMLKDLKMTVAGRLNIINTFGEDLDGLEVKRAENVKRRLKELVDTLVSIAHQLPDEIEHIAESQIFDLNTVLTANRKSHSDLLGILRKTQVEVEIETIQRWEDGRKYWRQLRHNKGLADFTEDILSERFTAPTDRIEYLTYVKGEQELRQERRLRQLKDLSELNAENITSKAVVAFQEECAVVADDELDAIQACYGRMGELREGLKDLAERRVEELRKELHVYGALHLEPPFQDIARALREALDDEDLAELWRLGGGLKPDFTSMNKDMCSVDLAYSDFVGSIEKRLELIVCGFNFKTVLEGRGRLMQLEKLRTLNTKLRTVPKGEVPSVITSIVPEIREVMEYDKLTDKFVEVLNTTAMEMEAEIERTKSHPANLEHGNSATGMSGTLGASDSQQTLRKGSVATGGTSIKTGKSSKNGSRASTAASIDMSMFVDQGKVKAWNRSLGILFYGADLTPAAQDACETGLKYCTEQHECNRLVDEAVLKQSAKELDLLNKRYKRLNDDITNFLEAQANYMAVCLTNVGTFFLDVAKAVEGHRAQQVALDNKSEDNLHELKEDFRIEREDREVVYEEACQKMRESVSLEELQDHFETVLGILDQVQDSYRVYHGDACFAADKYPLSLADDFKSFVESIASKFAMKPRKDHEILIEYNAIFDETIRLNQRFFQKDINAGGVVPRASDIARFETATGAKAAAEGEVGGSFENGVVDAEGSVGTGAGAGASTDDSEEKDSQAPQEEYISPLKAANAKKKKASKIACFSGSYDVTQSLSDFTQAFTIEKEEEDVAIGGEGTVQSTKAAPIPHPECIFVRKTFDRGVPLDSDGEAALDEYDLYDYEKALRKAFITLDEEQQAELPEELQALYQYVATRAREIDEKFTREEDPEVLRKKVPMCVTGNAHQSDNVSEGSMNSEDRAGEQAEQAEKEGTPWVLPFEIDLNIMQGLIGGIRDSLVTSVEIEAESRLKEAEKVKVGNKQKFTDELEDRLRTHWPRRGRVETGIKQPREAELLGHAEKTYRHIESIHEKMIAIQRHFVRECEITKQKCEDYVSEVQSIGDHVTSTTFRNLAVLQGIEVKARSLLLTFQNTNAKQLKAMRHIANNEVDAVMQYAVDFKKVCPKQEPGVEGGYSEAELEEIEALVQGQCKEAKSIQEEWNTDIEELVAVQEKSLESHTEFTAKYEETVQNVAMSEGLGQKYGAPRRRAQERIRSEVVRDEQSAGKIDEMLAKLEFVCDEVKRAAEIEEGDSVMPGSVAATVEADNGFNQTLQLKDAWHLLSSIRAAAQARVEYLDVVETALETPELVWISDRITRIDASVDGSSLAFDAANDEEDGDPDAEGEFKSKKTSLSQVMAEVDETCRSETRALYESEGKEDLLGDGGVPDSLAAWLEESKDKILGSNGHREKAWKRLWAQIERFEAVSGRVLEESDPENPDPPKNLPAPGACMRLIGDAMVRNMSYVKETEEQKFRKVVATFEAARDKHERLLRPRLGSPDAADELNELDGKETERSEEFSKAVLNFRAELVKELVDQACKFSEDLSTSSTSLIRYLDTSLRLEVIQLPPGTAVPKKRMTLKRLRKAQRLKAAIEAGEEDRSKERDWPPLDLSALLSVCKAAEDIAVSATSPPPAEEPLEAPNTKGKGKGKGKAAAAPEPDTPAGPPALLPQEWVDATRESSVSHGSVTTAHRRLIQERDDMMVQFVEALKEHLLAIRDNYSALLSAEESWIGRWRNQVGMLRSGDL